MQGIFGNKSRFLPPGTIKTLVNNGGQVKSVKQLFPSFGGQETEREEDLHIRVHERLHHKDRAVAYWDYERLSLEQFHELYKVKALQCTNKEIKNTPGHVTLVAIPDQRGSNILEPRCSQLLLEIIEQFMQSKAQPAIRVHAINPTYEPVLFDFYVSFLPGLDPGFYLDLLNNELKAFISPWSTDKTKDIYFGAIFFKTDIIRFIESRDYVDFISRFEMYCAGGETAVFGIDEMEIDDPGSLAELDEFVVDDLINPAIGEMEINDSFVVGRPVNVALATSPSGILVSVPSHRIRLLQPGVVACTTSFAGIGIGSMAIELDLIVI